MKQELKKLKEELIKSIEILVSNFANRENLDKVIEELMVKSPWAFGDRALRDLRRRMNMSRHHGFAKIE